LLAREPARSDPAQTRIRGRGRPCGYRRHDVLADAGRLADHLDGDEIDDLRAECDRQAVDGDVADG
jgi:hypothetical protein